MGQEGKSYNSWLSDTFCGILLKGMWMPCLRQVQRHGHLVTNGNTLHSRMLTSRNTWYTDQRPGCKLMFALLRTLILPDIQHLSDWKTPFFFKTKFRSCLLWEVFPYSLLPDTTNNSLLFTIFIIYTYIHCYPSHSWIHHKYLFSNRTLIKGEANYIKTGM